MDPEWRKCIWIAHLLSRADLFWYFLVHWVLYESMNPPRTRQYFLDGTEIFPVAFWVESQFELQLKIVEHWIGMDGDPGHEGKCNWKLQSIESGPGHFEGGYIVDFLRTLLIFSIFRQKFHFSKFPLPTASWHPLLYYEKKSLHRVRNEFSLVPSIFTPKNRCTMKNPSIRIEKKKHKKKSRATPRAIFTKKTADPLNRWGFPDLYSLLRKENLTPRTQWNFTCSKHLHASKEIYNE